MSDGFDLDKHVENDAEKVGSMVSGGVSRPPLGQMVVQAIFTLGVLSLILFLVMLPFVGESKLIPAEVWIGGGIMFMGFFFVIGAAIKMAVSFFEP